MNKPRPHSYYYGKSDVTDFPTTVNIEADLSRGLSERVTLNQFENLSREQLLDINPRLYNRHVTPYVAKELSTDESWRDYFPDAVTYGRTIDFSALAQQLRYRAQLEKMGVTVAPLDPKLTKAYESLTSQYIKYAQKELPLLDAEWNLETKYRSGIEELVAALPITQASSYGGVQLTQH